MGHFSVPCGLSGIPICGGDTIVGFNVEQASYHGHYEFIPINIPVEGTYDDYGRLTGKEDRSSDNNKLVLCHKELWHQATKCKEEKDYRNRESVSLKEFFNICKKEYADKMKEFEKFNNLPGIKAKDIGSNMAKSLAYLSINKKEEEYVGPHVYLNYLIKHDPSQALKHEWDNRIYNELQEFTDEQFTMLSQLAYVYTNVMKRGRQVTPTDHCFTEQDTDYKIEAQWHSAVSKFCNKTMKKRNIN